ncbi:MAG TPA: GntR family transcriptional regulator [Candidatus Acidoferrales bacterium]|nr:GntR family transcriptional regulator [Candidatus Acidoferrales bacterium]
MQLWFSRVNGISLREQLVTQIMLGILCDDLRPGERLPSTRELARRFRLHPNTVSAGYRQLHRERWVEFRRGSGVYVSESKPDVPASSSIALDRVVLNLFREARRLATSISTVRERLRYWLDLQPPDHFLLIEPRDELREILALEMHQGLNLQVKSCGVNPSEFLPALDGAIPATLARNANSIRKLLPVSVELIVLGVRSVPSSLAPWLPYSSGVLVGVASGWPEFLKLARTVLVAAGFHKDALILRDTRRPNWRRGLEQAAAVVCDSLTVSLLPKTCHPIVFPVLSDSSLRELQQYQEFVRGPIVSSL